MLAISENEVDRVSKQIDQCCVIMANPNTFYNG